MSRKRKLVNAAKVLGGLGAAYVAHDLAKPATVNLGVDRRGVEEEDEPSLFAKPSSVPAAPAPAAPVKARIVEPDFDSDTRDPGLFGVGRKKGGVISASRRADGIAQRGKTRGKMV